jgi:lysophospholipase L1-like esterase
MTYSALRSTLQAVLFIVYGLLCSPSFASPAATGPLFQPADHWVAIGDSISQDGRYLDWTECYLILRTPNSTITSRNAGISGDTADGALRRFDWDILPADRAATLATIMFGMNDVGRELYSSEKPDDTATLQLRQARLDSYARNLRTLVAQLQARGLRIALLTPSPYDDTSRADTANLPGANAALARCAATARAIARETGATLVDFHGPLTALVQRVQANEPTATPMGRDRIHPDNPGHFAMAYHLLRAQYPAGPIARVHLHGTAGTPRLLDSATLSEASGDITTPTGWTATYLARSLPFPVPEAARPALAWVPFTSELNTEELRVTGLPPGRYALEMDSRPIAEFSDTALSVGVNLAELPTPQRAQAEAVQALLQRRWTIVKNLRLLAKVQHWQAGEMKPPFTLAAMEAPLAAWEKKLQAQPGHWEAKNPGQYRSIKPTEDKLIAQAESLLAEARVAAQTQPRKLRLYRAANPTAQ